MVSNFVNLKEAIRSMETDPTTASQPIMPVEAATAARCHVTVPIDPQ